MNTTRAKQVAAIRRQAARLRKAAKTLDVAAIYLDDGALQTARDRLATARHQAILTVNYITPLSQAPGWPCPRCGHMNQLTAVTCSKCRKK